MPLTSASFNNGDPIPRRHAGLRIGGSNTSPALTWHAPTATRELLLVIEDLDAPTSRPIIHTAALIPGTVSELREGELVSDHSRLRHIPAYRERTGYHGPGPVPGHGTHHYGFHLFALDCAIPQDAEFKELADVLPHARGRVLAHGMLIGTMEAPQPDRSEEHTSELQSLV